MSLPSSAPRALAWAVALGALALLGGRAGLGARAGAASRGSATLAVTPNPVQAYSPMHVAGCGYVAGLGVNVQDQGPTTTETWGGTADASGCLAIDRKASAYPGSHTLKAYQYLKRSQASLMAQSGYSVTPQPLTVTSENYVFQWDPTKGCISEDDHADWTAAGYLLPGQSFSFTPRYPECNDPRAVMVKLSSTDPTARLVVSSVIPENDGLANAQTQKGTPVSAALSSGIARLCMFPNTTSLPNVNYTITVTNTGTASVNDVSLSGKDYNDWQVYYWGECLGADEDHDGWSDSLEHSMAQLIYPTGNFNNGAGPAGTDYARSCGTPTANDEFDTWPPDLDDDGVVTQADVSLISAHLGEGNGIPWSQITPNQGAANFWNHVGAWNRFDLNADGYVDTQDVNLVSSQLGKHCP